MALDPRSSRAVSARKHERRSSADRRELRRIRWTFTSGLVGARQQRPRDALVEVAVGDRVAARPRAGLLEQQEPPRLRGRRGEILAEALAEHGAGCGHVKSVSTPASTKAPAHTPSRLIHALRSIATPKRSYTSSATKPITATIAATCSTSPTALVSSAAPLAARGLDRVVVGRRAGRAGADQHRRDHQPGAVGAGHQERPPRQLAPVDAHRRPARVRARLHEAEDAEHDQRDARRQVQHRRVGHQPEPEHQRHDEHERELVADRDRRQGADDRAAVAVLHPERDREQPAHRGVQPVVGAERGDDRAAPRGPSQSFGKQ